jgi:hypothetical protein
VLVWWLVLGPLLALLLLFLFTSKTYNTIFQVIAESEYATGHLEIPNSQETDHLQWQLYDVSIRARGENGSRINYQADNVELTLSGPANFEVQRISDGDLYIALRELEGARDEFRVTATPDRQEPQRLYPPVFAVLSKPSAQADKGKAVSLPVMTTHFTLGREPTTRALRPQPVLRGGEVVIMGRTALQNRVFEARSIPLRGGDVVRAGDASASFWAFIRVDERPAMQVVARVGSEHIAISGFRTEPRIEKLTFFNKLAADHLLTALGSLLGLIIAALGVFARVRSGRPPDRQSDNSNVDQ